MSIAVVAVSCDICGGDDHEPFAAGPDYEYQTTLDIFQFVRCRRCAHVYLNPRPAESELGRIYPPTYYSYVQRQNRVAASGRIARMRERYHAAQLRKAFGDLIGPGARLRVLDVGCGDGRFLDMMRVAFGEAVETYGLDFDEGAVAVAAASGHRTKVATIEGADYPDAHFDVIYISHVIEHLASPRAFLETSHRLLRDGGIVHVETPNVDCAEARIARRTYWGGYHFPRHWHLFAPQTIARLGRDCGFSVGPPAFATSPVFLNWTCHHILWKHRTTRPLSEVFSVTGIYKNTLYALALVLGFAAVERALRVASGGRGSGMVTRLTKQ
jgi:2-polyprenyl-3-methyl-5-hydroxy-6-metoxy-1,4-benzoquinol methylase